MLQLSLTLAIEVQGERRAEFTRAMLSRSLHSRYQFLIALRRYYAIMRLKNWGK